MNDIGAAPESPRAVADKRSKPALLRAIRMALRVESAAVRHNTQAFNRGRYREVAELTDYDALKDRARQIKEEAITRLPELLATLQSSVLAAGGHFYLASSAQEATQYIAETCRRSGSRLVVKGKSMTSEEVGINRRLAAEHMEVAETDLAEFILQVADEQPSHIVAPAMHYSRERITELFRRVFATDEPLDTGEELTRFARERLRQKFLAADVGITGANLIAADSATLMLVESEGNIRMSSLLPPLHIAIAGIEKVVPSRGDFAPFLELLGSSFNGQRMTSYTSIISPPLSDPVLQEKGQAPQRQFHLVLVDNGRTAMREDPVLREALYCIRCSACLNSCANFQAVGGHAFGGETYAGGIGAAWEAGTRSLAAARFSELCTGCTRCINQCPVRIDVPWLNTVLRQRLNKMNASPVARLRKPQPTPGTNDDWPAPIVKLFWGRYGMIARWGARLPSLSNRLAKSALVRRIMHSAVGLDRRRELPSFPRETLVPAARREMAPTIEHAIGKVALLADVFTNYTSPQRGLAAINVLRAMGVDVATSEVIADGRSELSQGLIAAATRQARAAAECVGVFLDEDRDLIIVEPSVLAMFRLDYRHLLAPEQYERLRQRSFDPAEYIWRLLQQDAGRAAQLFDAGRSQVGVRIFYHAHCQQRTIGAAAANEALLRATGFDVISSQVECCGMAGSFGYKRDFYELSMAVGEDLFAQVRAAESDGERILVASGTSCQEQLHAGLKRNVLHPMQVLDSVLRNEK